MRRAGRTCPAALSRLAGVALLACTLLLAGCGLGLVYPRLDTLVGHHIRGLVSLDDAQAAELEAVLAGNLDWHRRSELARYDAFLRGLAAEVATGLDRAELERATEQAVAYWRGVQRQAAPGYAALAGTLSDAQVRELLGSLARDDAEEFRETQERSGQGTLRKREKSLRRSVERLTGPLDARQRELLAQYLVRLGPETEGWQESRKAWRDALAAALAERSDPVALRARFERLLVYPEQYWTPAHRRVVEANRARFLDFAVALESTLTVTQRRAVQRELLALADELRSLARRA